jgi:hypothetical protein
MVIRPKSPLHIPYAELPLHLQQIIDNAVETDPKKINQHIEAHVFTHNKGFVRGKDSEEWYRAFAHAKVMAASLGHRDGLPGELRKTVKHFNSVQIVPEGKKKGIILQRLETPETWEGDHDAKTLNDSFKSKAEIPTSWKYYEKE